MKKIIKGLLFAAAILIASPKLFAQVSIGISIRVNPPALPVYTQPACPTDGYLWVPGYWAYDNNSADYYWVPGVWVSPPQPGYLWTPGYWGYNGDVYAFHRGYWGVHVGFYGGVNYGYGYGGSGFYGGQWSGNSFRYNTAVVNVNNTVVHNTYVDKTVIVNNNTTINNHTSFNGPGGVTAKPRPEEIAAMHENHINATAEQQSHQRVAKSDRSQYASVNKGRPATAVMNKVNGDRFNGEGHPSKAGAPKQSNDRQANAGNNNNNMDKVNGASNDNFKDQPKAADNAAKPGNPDEQHADEPKKINSDAPENKAKRAPANKPRVQHKQNAPRRPANNQGEHRKEGHR